MVVGLGVKEKLAVIYSPPRFSLSLPTVGLGVEVKLWRWLDSWQWFSVVVLGLGVEEKLAVVYPPLAF